MYQTAEHNMPEDYSPIHPKDEDRNFFQKVSTYVFCILTTINNSKYPKFKKKKKKTPSLLYKNVKFHFYPTFPQFPKDISEGSQASPACRPPKKQYKDENMEDW